MPLDPDDETRLITLKHDVDRTTLLLTALTAELNEENLAPRLERLEREVSQMARVIIRLAIALNVAHLVAEYIDAHAGDDE